MKIPEEQEHLVEPPFNVRTLTSWQEILEACGHLAGRGWLFRGHHDAEWTLKTSLEREFETVTPDLEQTIYWHFVRSAPRSLQPHLTPADDDAAAWLGLIQHYGGPTRLLDVTRSPFVALYFAFEAPGLHDRALWAIDPAWCMEATALTMATIENISESVAIERTMAAQAQLVYSLVHRRRHPMPLFSTFQPFSGVFPVEPWKPDQRQSAQQAMFLCTADATGSFESNLASHRAPPWCVQRKLILPSRLRPEALEQLWMMNVTAATLFPDLGGLARSLRVLPARRVRDPKERAPWEGV